jgi:predicted dehydrogenase
MRKVTVLLVGVGGFGAGYVRELLAGAAKDRVRVVGVADPYAAGSPAYQLIQAAGVPVYDTAEAFYASNEAELAIIATPIQFHTQQAVCCLEAGSHVLLEKPIAATVEQARAILDARDRSGRLLAVGFQWCYDAAMLRLKDDVRKGLYGAPRHLKALVLWPRDRAYYRRGLGWAGKRFAPNGAPIFDNVVSNATAHYLFNMLWLPGEGFEGQGLASLQARVYRANDIETFDTVVLKGQTQGGAALWFGASHAAGKDWVQEPVFEYKFEGASLRFGALGGVGDRLTAWKDGRIIKDYGPTSLNDLQKLHTMLDAITCGAPIPCPGEAALQHAQAMALLRGACPEAPFFAPDRIREEDSLRTVEGLGREMTALYREARLPDAL